MQGDLICEECKSSESVNLCSCCDSPHALCSACLLPHQRRSVNSFWCASKWTWLRLSLEILTVSFAVSLYLSSGKCVAGPPPQCRTSTAPDTIYLGELRDTKPSGLGFRIVRNDIYEAGTWAHGDKQGRFCECSQEALCWVEYVDGVKSGQGQCLTKDGRTYSGYYVEGEKHGKGVETYPAEKFAGEFDNGVRKSGKYQQESKFRKEYLTEKEKLKELEGTLRGGFTQEGRQSLLKYGIEDAQTLFRLIKLPMGVYEGLISLKAQPNHFGLLAYNDGNVYEGFFESGIRSGNGKMTYANKTVYDGEWKNDKWNGYGTLEVPGRRTVKGTWFDGEIDGFAQIEEYQAGTTHTDRNETYIGEFTWGKRHGLGAVYVKGQLETGGRWEGGKPTTEEAILEM